MRRSAAIHAMVLGTVLALVSTTVGWAQSEVPSPAPADSTAAAPDSAATDSTTNSSDAASLSDIGQRVVQNGGADASADSAATASKTVEIPWYEPFRPTLTTTVQANVSEVGVKGKLSAPVFQSIGATGSVEAEVGRKTYRQFDRDQETESLVGNLSREFSEGINLKVNFTKRSSFDENRPAGIDPIVLELDSEDAQANLTGDQVLGNGFSHHWAVAGRFENVDQVNRRVRNDRSLASAGLTSVWKQTSEEFDLSARYGYNRSSGERLIRGVTGDASVEVDTLQTKFELTGLPRSSVNLAAERSTFFEERLDFARNANGVVDTTNVADPVGQEREVREGYKVSAQVDTRPLHFMRLRSSASRDFSETVFRLSREGLVERGSESLDAGATLRHAAAGSLQVDYSYSDRFNDRRAQGNAEFRGRESTRSYSLEAELRQALFAQSDLRLSASQALTQYVFLEQSNNNNRDRLVDQGIGEIKTDALPHTRLTVGGTLRRTQEINLASDRVGNNKEELLYEVRGNYTFDPPGGFRATQTYRLQIVFRDFVDSDDRDTFNKQGQVTTRVDYYFASGGSANLEYLADYRSTGSRDEREPVREVYITDSIREDRRFSAGASMPLAGLTFSANVERGFLDQESGSRVTSQERGKLNLKSSGQWKFLEGRVTLDLDVERVLQFGPRVREEQADYWVANSVLTVLF